jgi:quaternary ammonium compound-resistance protein SugE
MNWLLLLLAGLFEIGWAVGLKYSQGFSRPGATAWTIICLIISLGLLALAVKDLPLGTAYAVWTGIGTVGTVIFGIVFLGDAFTLVRVGCIVLILAGILGLKVTV